MEPSLWHLQKPNKQDRNDGITVVMKWNYEENAITLSLFEL